MILSNTVIEICKYTCNDLTRSHMHFLAEMVAKNKHWIWLSDIQKALSTEPDYVIKKLARDLHSKGIIAFSDSDSNCCLTRFGQDFVEFLKVPSENSSKEDK